MEYIAGQSIEIEVGDRWVHAVVEATDREVTTVRYELGGFPRRTQSPNGMLVSRAIADTPTAPEPRRVDALGRGLPGYARGAVKRVTRWDRRTKTPKARECWEFRYTDADGRNRTRNLRKAIARDFRRDWEAGMTAVELLKKYRLTQPKR